MGVGARYVQGDSDLVIQKFRTPRACQSCFVTSQVSTYYEVNRGRNYLALEEFVYYANLGDAYGYLLVATGGRRSWSMRS